MSDLADKKCIPCEGGIPSFNLDEIHKYLKKVDGWDVKKNENENEGTVFELEQFEGEKSAKIWKNSGGLKKFSDPCLTKTIVTLLQYVQFF